MERCVAAVQMVSRDHDVEGNLERAVPFVEDAKARGAELVCLPEFLPSGYRFDESVWEVAEAPDGTTVQWLERHARRLGLWIAAAHR